MRTFAISVLAMVVAICGGVLASGPQEVRTISGTYTCMACHEAQLQGKTSQCAIYGHQYGLLLNDGRYITFLNNDHAQELVKGGGRHDFPMKVTGLYDPRARTISVQSYEIDGIKTTWCAEHQCMDRCGDHQAKRSLASVSK